MDPPAHSQRRPRAGSSLEACVPRRVLILPLPRLLQDIVYQLFSGVDEVDVCERSEGAASLVEAAWLSSADVVIAGERDATPQAAFELLKEMPLARVLAVSHDGRFGVVYEMRPERHAIGELSAATMRSVVNAAAPSSELLLADPNPRSAP